MSDTRFFEREDGVSLPELLVIMVIICILLGGAMFSASGARKNGKQGQMLLTATAYAKAVDSFRLDHGGRVPTSASAFWPSAAIEAGPVDVLTNPPRPYLRGGVPDPVKDGIVRFSALGVTVGPANSKYTVDYQPTSATTYSIVATNLWTGRVCTLANGSGASCQ